MGYASGSFAFFLVVFQKKEENSPNGIEGVILYCDNNP